MVQKKVSSFHSAVGILRRQFFKAFIFSMFLNLTILVVPLYMLQIYDRVLSSQSTDTLIVLTVLAGGLLVAMALVEMARSWLLVQSATWLDNALNSGLFKLALSNRLQGDQGSASQPMRDMDTLRSFLTGPGLPALFDTPWVPLYLGIMFFMHPVFGFIAVFGAFVILCIAILSELSTKEATKESNTAHQTSNSFLESLSRNAESIHAMGMVGNLSKLWLKSHEAGVAWQEVAGDRAAILNSIAKAFRMSLQVAILGSGAYLAIQQVITPGVMIAASIIMSRALAPAEAAISNWRSFIATRQAYLRLKEIFAAVEHTEEKAQLELPPPTGRLEVEKVFMRHPGSDDWLLQNVTFEINPGDILGIVGPSGIGKTSLIKLLVGLKKPNIGSVRLDGMELCNWGFEKIGPHIGYVPQDVELLLGSVAHNICRFSDIDSDQVVEAAKLAGAHDLIVRLPNSYDTVLGEGGSKVSGGQRQRIALARALYNDPNYIVLDEPNSNLDLEGQQALQTTLRKLKAMGKTVIVVSHRASVLAMTNKLLVLKAGNEHMFGPRDSVIQKLENQAQQQSQSYTPKQAEMA